MTSHKYQIGLLFLSSILLSGCMLTLNGLGSKEQAVFKEQLLGIWLDDSADKGTWTFTKDDEDAAYRLIITSDKPEEGKGEFIVRLFELGGHLFLDMSPHESMLTEQAGKKTRIDLYNWCLLPGHMIARIKSMSPTLQMTFLSPDIAQKLKPEQLKDIEIQEIGDRKVITSTTPKLRAFVTAIAGDEKIWGDASEMKRVK